MLAIRMQRTGRKGHAMFRVIVQDSRRTPTSGKTVAQLGSYDPHAKTLIINKEKASFYLDHGAQPSDRVVRLLKNEGIKLPNWVKTPAAKQSTTRNAEKRRSTRPPEPVEATPAEPAPPTEEAPVTTEETTLPDKVDDPTPLDLASEEATTSPEPSESQPAPNDTPSQDAPAEDQLPADEAPAEDAKNT